MGCGLDTSIIDYMGGSRLRVSAVTAPADWRSYQTTSLSPILSSALTAFAEHGYHGTSIRDIARGSGLSVPGLYHHYQSKQHILVDLVLTVMRSLLSRSEAALASAGDDPRDQFDALVECLLRFHMFRRPEAFVASTELRSIEPEHRDRYIALRDQQQQLVTDALIAGCSIGEFSTPYPEDASRAVATVCVGVATWYRVDGPLGPDELVARHLTLIHGMVGARPVNP